MYFILSPDLPSSLSACALFPSGVRFIPDYVALLRCVSIHVSQNEKSGEPPFLFFLTKARIAAVFGSDVFYFFSAKAFDSDVGLYCSRKEGISMMTVHEVSRRTGVSVRTLQYYDKMGLLPRRRAQKRPIGCMTMRHWNAYSRFCCFARWRFRSKRFRRFCKARTLTGIGR